MLAVNKLDPLIPIINAHKKELLVDEVQSIRPGYKLDNKGWPTAEEAIVVFPKSDDFPILPASVSGIPVEVRQPNVFDQARMAQPEMFSKLAADRPEFETGAFTKFSARTVSPLTTGLTPQVLAAKPQLAYTTPPNGTRLQPVSGRIAATCHAGPDAGWLTLKKFLNNAQTSLTIGMYDFTSRHILQEFEQALAGKEVTLTLDHPAPNPTADQTDDQTVQELTASALASLEQAWALVKTNPKVNEWIFPNAYHFKVAVRDSSAVWLSSSNWNNSNQPDIDPLNNPQPTDQAIAKKSDRDWHVIIESTGIAK